MKNIGTGDVEDMTYSLDIYLTDSTKTRGLLAKDSTGQDLSWTNEVAFTTLPPVTRPRSRPTPSTRAVQPPLPWCRHHVDPRRW